MQTTGALPGVILRASSQGQQLYGHLGDLTRQSSSLCPLGTITRDLRPWVPARGQGVSKIAKQTVPGMRKIPVHQPGVGAGFTKSGYWSCFPVAVPGSSMAGQEHRLASDFPRVLWSLAEPAFFSVLLAQVHEKLDSVLGSLEPALQVDLVWALCVLQQVQVAELQTVLHPGLHTRFLGEHALPWNMEAFWSVSQGRH